MYVLGNPKTKTELKKWLLEGRPVQIFSPGPFPAPTEGNVAVEGPHYPKPHKWYARVQVINGLITKVLA